MTNHDQKCEESNLNKVITMGPGDHQVGLVGLQLFESDVFSSGHRNTDQHPYSNLTLDEDICNKLTLASWASNYKPEDIDGGLATDFDGSLQGLGVEVEADAYDMR